MRHLFVLLLSLFVLTSYSQIKFEPGYFIDNNLRKTDCLIKNTEWRNNPNVFYYKLTDMDSIHKATIDSVSEFGVYNGDTYVREIIEIDRSPLELIDLSQQRSPKFETDTLFLKFLVKGSANLFSFNDGNLSRYLYSVDSLQTKQLIYKKYYQTKKKIAENKDFQLQLLQDVNCGDRPFSDFTRLGYSERELVRFFEDYNFCKNPTQTIQIINNKKSAFHLAITPGLNFSKFKILDALYEEDLDYGFKFNARLGLEAEWILPFHKNTWGVFIEPTFQSYHSSKVIQQSTIDINSEVAYNSIELPVGLRHYIFLQDDLKLFFNALFVFDFSFNSTYKFETKEDVTLASSYHEGLGAGLEYKKLGVELRYYHGQLLFRQGFRNWEAYYPTAAFILKYRFVDLKF